MIATARSADRGDCAFGTRGEHQRAAFGEIIAADADRAGRAAGLSFRYFDASDRGRFGNLGLMTDDAGH